MNVGRNKIKLKEGVFVGPDTCKLMFDCNFQARLITNGISFKLVVTKFLDNGKDQNYEPIIVNMIA